MNKADAADKEMIELVCIKKKYLFRIFIEILYFRLNLNYVNY
jgi:hypothetical protein